MPVPGPAFTQPCPTWGWAGIALACAPPREGTAGLIPLCEDHPIVSCNMLSLLPMVWIGSVRIH